MPRLALILLAVLLPAVLLASPSRADGGRTVRVIEQPDVSQPGPFSNRGHTVVVPRTRIEIDQGDGNPTVVPAAPVSETVTGKVGQVVDGDTLEVGGRRVRLYGIDAPAKDATCTAAGKAWPCGSDALFALAYETAGHWLRCEGKGELAGGALIAVCFVGPYDLGALMVRKGWARADRPVSLDYIDDETQAREAAAGIWRGGPSRP